MGLDTHSQVAPGLEDQEAHLGPEEGRLAPGCTCTARTP